MKWIAGVAIIIGGLIGLYYLKYPVYSHRYRLTVSIEVEGKVHSGSSIIEIGWQRGPPLGDAGGYAPIIRGQAALVDLGDRGVVVAALMTGEGYGPAKDGALSAQWLAAEAFGNHSAGDEIPELPKLRGKRDIALNKLPRLLWFRDRQDPTTAQKFMVQDIPAIFGPEARFAGASVEITSDPIVVDIRQKLPWLKPLEDKSPGSNVIYLPNHLGMSRYMFIEDAS